MSWNSVKECEQCGSRNIETYSDENLRACNRCRDCGSESVRWWVEWKRGDAYADAWYDQLIERGA